MRVTCQHCGKGLNIPDDKAPPGSFQLTCPACKKRFVVVADRVAGAADRDPEPAPVPDAPVPADVGGMPKLRRMDRELLSSIVPEAFIVDLGQSPLPSLATDLERLGMEDVRHFTSLEEALEVLSDTGAGILVIRMDKASAPPCEPLAPLEGLSYAERRRTFVVLVADNVKSLDGQVAFFLQVNCLINVRDASRFGALVRRALLHDLRLYRYWPVESG